MDAFSYFVSAHLLGLKPSLLEFTHPIKQSPLVICGIRPKAILEVRDDKLFKDHVAIGDAIDIFHHLQLEKSSKFFPSFLGYFAYDFANYLGKPTKISRDFPAAYFLLYDQGLVIDGDKIFHHSPLENMKEICPKPFHANDIVPSMSESNFSSIVANIKERIRKGDVYQVNISLPFSFTVRDDDIFNIYHAMRLNNKSPFMGIMSMGDAWILSGSPERLFAFNGDEIITRPIAGTKKRGDSDEEEALIVEQLRNCPKENAEHAMLVDLLRNDLNQIASPGTVKVEEDRSIEIL